MVGKGGRFYCKVSLYTLVSNRQGHIFTGTYFRGIHRLTDKNEGWQEVNKGDLKDYYSVETLAINACGHIFAGTDGHGMFRSMNGGESWAQLDSGITNEDHISAIITHDDAIFAGTLIGEIYRSTDNGDSWKAMSTALINSQVMSIVSNKKGLYAGTYGDGVFHSVDGIHWWPMNEGMQNKKVRSLTVSKDGTIFAGTEAGVYSSNTSGELWTIEYIEGYPRIRKLFWNDGTLLVNTHAGEFFRLQRK